MRQGRSSLPAFVIEVVHRSGESDPSAASTSDAIEDVVERGGAGEASQFAREVLLQRLSFRPGAPLQVCVDILWEISDQHIRHACILLSRRTQMQPPRPASIARYARFQSGFPPLPAAAVDRTNLAPHLHHSHLHLPPAYDDGVAWREPGWCPAPRRIGNTSTGRRCRSAICRGQVSAEAVLCFIG